MATCTENSQHQQRLMELVYDEEKIITTALIANDLKISLKDANNLLTQFIKDYPKLKLGEIYSTYLLCGTLKDNKGAAINLVKGQDLEQKRALFDNVSSEVIYSVQKAKQIDYNLIALTDSTIDNFTGSLVSKNCIKRNIKAKTLPPLPTSVKEKPSFFKKIDPQPKAASEEKKETSLPSSQKQNKPSVSTKPKQNGGIASFFAKVPPKSESKSVQNTKETETKNNDKPEPKTAKHTEEEIEDTNNEIENAKEKSEEFPKESQNCQEMDVDVQEEKPTKKESQSNNNKKRKKKSKNNLPNKKRKRIQEMCDSDSDIFEDEESEGVIEKSDEEPEVPVIKPTPVPKNKRRKAIDKTYVDEEGFIVTATEYIYESASEDEKEVVKNGSEKKPQVLTEKKNNKPEPEKTTTTKGKNKKPVGGKQPTLMSFFKKN